MKPVSLEFTCNLPIHVTLLKAKWDTESRNWPAIGQHRWRPCAMQAATPNGFWDKFVFNQLWKLRNENVRDAWNRTQSVEKWRQKVRRQATSKAHTDKISRVCYLFAGIQKFQGSGLHSSCHVSCLSNDSYLLVCMFVCLGLCVCLLYASNNWPKHYYLWESTFSHSI